MRFSIRSLAGPLAAFLVALAAATAARAETYTLELKRLDRESRSNTDQAYRATYPQGFFVQMVKGQGRIGDARQAEVFKRIVKKEPKYQSQNPFRGVAKLGSQQFAFALDFVPPASKEAKPDVMKDEKAKADSATGKLAEKVAKTADAKKPAAGAVAYNRLYFDLNCNGDLADDKVIESETRGGPQANGPAGHSRASFRFPRIDLTVDNDGVKTDYSFFVDGQSYVSPDFSYLQVSLNAGAYREGDVTLDGKKHHIALIDFNSNGRFGDEIKIQKVHYSRGGKAVAENRPSTGDMFVIDPTPDGDSSYDVTESNCRHHVSKLIGIDGRFYSVKISPAGDKLTLEPSSAAIGKVTNPNSSYRAVIYSDAGFLKIQGDKNTPADVPEGEWKLLAYTIKHTEAAKAKKEGEKAASQPAVVTAEMTGEYKPVKVVKGETVEFPFGPPYKPTVSANYFEDGPQNKVLSLALSLVGSAGETCSDMSVNGDRPSKPDFTIADAKGKVVEEGSFEYG
jgi:hypothetical protein